jgi:hypothetical protein
VVALEEAELHIRTGVAVGAAAELVLPDRTRIEV